MSLTNDYINHRDFGLFKLLKYGDSSEDYLKKYLGIIFDNNQKKNIINRGTGAGGSNTNTN